jgi:hypothetical protein
MPSSTKVRDVVSLHTPTCLGEHTASPRQTSQPPLRSLPRCRTEGSDLHLDEEMETAAIGERERLKLHANDPIDRHGTDPLSGPSKDAACAMEHRAPSGKGSRRGERGTSEPAADLATTHQESTPTLTATLRSPPRCRGIGGTRRPLNTE